MEMEMETEMEAAAVMTRTTETVEMVREAAEIAQIEQIRQIMGWMVREQCLTIMELEQKQLLKVSDIRGTIPGFLFFYYHSVQGFYTMI
jgi:hypothetical protein